MSLKANPSAARALGARRAGGRSRPSRLWWLYLAYLVLSGAISARSYLSSIREANLSGGMLAVPMVATLLNLWGLLGLWGYIRSRRLGWSGLWQACLGLTVIQWIYSASLFARVLSLGGESRQTPVAALGLLGLALGAPLLVALWRYAFLSPEIWRR